ALVPPLKRSRDVRHTLTALPALPQLSLLFRREPCPCMPLHSHTSSSAKIRRCCVDSLNSPPKSGQTLVVGGQAQPQGAGRLVRLDVEFLRESAPLLLLSADDLRGTLRRTAAVCRQTKRQEPLLDFGAAEVEIDLVIELRDHFRWCACWRDNR